ncbi:MAG: RNA-splicing ligase RtcB [Pseudopedobacter saltans]|uniref:3'-phosphate/5'-hydroxy nucleic acid ligase n=1 Tax=Pseudopedobacter saltans TaxID=151895 RepID=A0A2W5FD80_9SPHI|nr:MAG: RNA-splicing ligase RtcB [Pseudopedobacter saltans]
MGNIKPKELSKLGLVDDAARSLTLNIISKNYKHHSREEIISLIKDVVISPGKYQSDSVWKSVAAKLIGDIVSNDFQVYDLLKVPQMLKVFGGKQIESLAKQQIDYCLRLPIALQGALMADAHEGFGMPIGGVLATANTVIPYAVGQDIGCRMALSIIDERPSYLKRNSFAIKNAIKYFTHFGMDGHLEFEQEHAILEDARFQETALLKSVFPKAVYQLGTSGGGNHFVEMGTVRLKEGNTVGVPAGEYVGLLSHSGSRGVGATIAKYFIQLAMEKCRLPKQAKSLAWLDLNSDEGMEYWLSMQLAGDYAKACHEQIHRNVLKSLGLDAIAVVENHHNFAWKEQNEKGEDIIVHRKGATPAHKGELGIIPGNMVDDAFIVSGRGASSSLQSASHGAGRLMSRQKAKDSMTVSDLKKRLNQYGVTLIGGSVEEHPFAYKDISTVMEAQKELVDVQGVFTPKIVRMNKE